MNIEAHLAPILVVGIGNILLKDEGVGVRVVEELASRYALSEEVELLDGGTAGFDLLSSLKGRRKIIIIDALKMDDAPGSVYRCSPSDLVERTAGYSLHDVGVLGVIRILRILGEQSDIEIVGIVPEDVSTMEIALSDSVEPAVGAAAALVVSIIDEWLSGNECCCKKCGVSDVERLAISDVES